MRALRASRWLLDDLPVRVLPDDLSVAKLPMVTAAHADATALRRRAGQKPLGDAEVATDPVPVITIVDIRKSSEARCQRLAHGGFAREALSPRLWPTGHVQGAIVGEELHDHVEIVGVECVEDRLQCLARHRVLLGHGLPRLAPS